MKEISDLKEEIGFYHEVVLNTLFEVDIPFNFLKSKMFIISNIKLEKYFLKNSIDNMTGLANDKEYQRYFDNINNIIDNKEVDNVNIMTKGKRAKDFIAMITQSDEGPIALNLTISNLLKANSLDFYITKKTDNKQRFYSYRLTF